ncbi:hypothetical protein [Enterococcus sp. DIV0800]|uniref:hypothetical protein n=1 Tax=Enterococcus sp. DIV0800 TaxID=2774646 RepID=UPI003D2FE24E
MRNEKNLVFLFLKSEAMRRSGAPLLIFFGFFWQTKGHKLPPTVNSAFIKLELRDQLEVIEAFADDFLKRAGIPLPKFGKRFPLDEQQKSVLSFLSGDELNLYNSPLMTLAHFSFAASEQNMPSDVYLDFFNLSPINQLEVLEVYINDQFKKIRRSLPEIRNDFEDTKLDHTLSGGAKTAHYYKLLKELDRDFNAYEINHNTPDLNRTEIRIFNKIISTIQQNESTE